jgi:hypothetical protein
MSELSLNCWVVGDDAEQVFTVKIPPTENVSILKKMIKDENNFPFPAKDLLLWKVSLPVDNDLDSELLSLPLDNDSKLSPPSKELSSFFDEPERGHLHVIVKPPTSASP